MRRLLILTALLLVAASAAAVAAPRRATVGVRATKLGPTVVDGRGRTLYVFDRPSCTGGCAQTWPPFLTGGKPLAHGVPAARLGTKKLAGGKLQVTFAGRLLYFYAGDFGSGQVAGASVPHWAALSPTGAKLTDAGSTTPTDPTTTPDYGGGGGGY